MVNSGSLLVTTVLFCQSIVAEPPYALAMSAAISFIRFIICNRMFESKVRTVPIISADSGIILKRVPEVIFPTVITAASSVSLASRLIMV